MLNVIKTHIIDKNSKKYLSFPDIIKSPKSPDRLFLIYREGDNHHPLWSKLILLRSNNNGESWFQVNEFYTDIKNDGAVWNCPRLSYVDNDLYIICDLKNSRVEKTAQFKTVFLISKDEGETFITRDTAFPGMVPDKIIKFQGSLFCANHKIKSSKNDLIQLISWSQDKGETWYNTNVIANNKKIQFCEASIVRMKDYLIAYLRDNSGHKRNVYMAKSTNGVYWDEPIKLPILGQRVTALRDGENVIGAYRNTDLPLIPSSRDKLKVSVFEHNIKKEEISLSEIDWEYPENQYHFGYTGMVKINSDQYIIAYYIKKRADNPFIKLAFVNKTEV